jgi:hypothetical protein
LRCHLNRTLLPLWLPSPIAILTVFKTLLTAAYLRVLSAVAEEDVWLAVFEGAAKMVV